MSIWFTKRERGRRTSRFSASIPFTLIFILLVFAILGLLRLLRLFGLL